jgi:hypothetical protein
MIEVEDFPMLQAHMQMTEEWFRPAFTSGTLLCPRKFAGAFGWMNNRE